MATRARSNRATGSPRRPYQQGTKIWQRRRKGSYIKGKLWGSKSKYNRTQANRRERRKPIETED